MAIYGRDFAHAMGVLCKRLSQEDERYFCNFFAIYCFCWDLFLWSNQWENAKGACMMPINSQNYVPQEEIGFTQGKIVFNKQNKCILIGCALFEKIS